MIAITEERGKKGASRKEKRERKERRTVEGKLPRHRVVANGINFRDFSSLCGLHMAVNINRFSPGEFPSPGPRPQKIYDNSDVPPCERKNRAEKWRGKRKKKRKKKGGEGEIEKVEKQRRSYVCRARCRSIPRENAFGVDIVVLRGGTNARDDFAL